MSKQIFGISLLVLMLLPGCTRGPMREQMDSSLPATNSPPIDLNAATARAKAENKIVLLDFTGSDWCPPCMKLHEEVFAQPAFQSYADSNLVLLVVDFPSKFHLSSAASATNDFLAKKFNIEGFPTLLALNGDGQEIWQNIGYIEGGPKEVIGRLDAAKSKGK